MNGIDTLSKLYLGAELAEATVQDDQLRLVLADGRNIDIPLQLVGQCNTDEPLPASVQLIILRHPAQIEHIHVTDSVLNVYLKDGRVLSCPLAWFPRLVHGTPAERNDYLLSGQTDTNGELAMAPSTVGIRRGNIERKAR